MKRISVLVAVVIIASVLLTACGGGSAGGSPSATAKSFFDAFSQLDFTKMKDITCSAQKSAMDQALSAFNVAGANADALKQSLKIDTSGLTFSEKSVNGNNAVVVMSGKLSMSFMGQSQDQPVNNQELPMVNEGGAWKVCSSNPLGGQ